MLQVLHLVNDSKERVNWDQNIGWRSVNATVLHRKAQTRKPRNSVYPKYSIFLPLLQAHLPLLPVVQWKSALGLIHLILLPKIRL